MTRLTRISLLLAVFFAIDKVSAILRQVIIARLFGLSAELDAFNVANNIPDLLFALISGGALAVAFIPVLSEVLTREGKQKAWLLFSRVANLAFIITAILAGVVAILARKMVGWELGIAPGFNASQQDLVVTLMRFNLIATLIFSISGLVMAGLQANQHFLLPAMAPLLYNVGQIFGAVFLAPEKGLNIGNFTLPAMGMGIHGLVLGVILGAVLHLSIQIPGLIKYKFTWKLSINIQDEAVRKVMRLMGPRILNIFIIQLIFLVRDNLGSRLEEGAVSALAYGWMIQQVPETLIGTAIGTALLPTLAELVSKEEKQALKDTIERAMKVLLAVTLPAAVIIGTALGPFIRIVFGFDDQDTALTLWVTRGYLVGLTGHCLLELAARSFYAQQNAVIPLLGSILNVTIYIFCGIVLFQKLGAPGISLTDSIAFTAQAVFLLLILNHRLVGKLAGARSLRKGIIGAVVGGIMTWLLVRVGSRETTPLMLSLTAGGAVVGGSAALFIIRDEVRLLLRL